MKIILFKKKKEGCNKLYIFDLSRQDFYIWLLRVEYEWEEIFFLLLGFFDKDI